MKNKRAYKKVLFVLLSAVLLIAGTMPISAHAENTAGSLCLHHQKHTAECSYTEGSEGTPCNHTHDDACGYVAAAEEIPCSMNCTDINADGIIDHQESCAYASAVEGAPCQHQHDENCGYSPAVAGTPCTYVCEICNSQSSDDPAGPECACETLCTEDAVNTDCPVCGVDGADLTLCMGIAALDKSGAVQLDTSKLDALDTVIGGTPAINGTVTNFEALVSAVSAAPADGTETVVTLGGDMEFTQTVTIQSGQNIVITDDGTARTISAASDPRVSTAFSVSEGGILTIKTSVPGNDELLKINGENFHSFWNGAKIVLVKGTFTLEGGTISGNYDTSSTCSGVITVFGQNALFRMDGGVITGNTFTGQYGGTIYASAGAVFEMYGGVISNNTGTDPLNNATIYIEADDGDSAFHMHSGIITGNQAAYGGVFLGKPAYPDFSSRAQMIMYDGAVISSNTAIGQGGGGVMVCGQAEFTMNGGVIQNNTAYIGGGVCAYDMYYDQGGAGVYDIETWSGFFPAAFTMNGGTIQGNQAVTGNEFGDAGCGGGIYVGSNNVTLRGGIISDNEAVRQGGGVYVGSVPYVMTIYDALVTNNTATILGGGIWACPTGDTEVFVTNGVGIYDNTSTGAGDDVVSVKTDGQNYVLTLANRILGGGQVLWYKDGGIEADSGILGNPDTSPRYQSGDTPISEIKNSIEPYALKAVVSDNAKELAQKSATLLITGNQSQRGGGIGTNGGVIMGEKEREYTLKVKKNWNDADEALKQPVTVYLKVGDTVLDPVTLSADNNWEAEFKELPDPDTLGEVSYAVVENPVPENFTAAYQPAVIDKENRIITIDISNTYQPTGSLTVSKTVSGNTVDQSKDWNFTVTLEDTSINGQYGEMTFTDGVAQFTLKHNQSKTATGLPAGIRYTVTESGNAGYTVTSTGETGSIPAGDTAVALFNNHKSGEDSGNDKVSVTVKKVWKLDNGGKATNTVTVVLLKDGKEYQRIELSDQNGWTYTWAGLSDQYTWTVAEANVPDGFTSKVDQEGMIFTITNDDKPPVPENPSDPDKPTDDNPQTGDETNLALWLVLLGISGTGIAITLLGSKHRYKGKHNK